MRPKRNQEKRANEIVRCLCEAGWDAYIVGGAARDLLMGENPQDFDVVTKAPYDVIKKLFQNRKVTLVGSSFKVCIVDGVEISTYRKDVCFGLSDPHCPIEEVESLKEDLSRRDLTINALAICPYTGEVVDEYGGIGDLNHRIIKFTGNPKDRIMEDPCRIIRACRFCAKIEGKFDPATFQALKKHCALAKKYVAPERIRLELLKALAYKRPSLFFDALFTIDLLDLISPSLNACYGHGGGYHHGETIDVHVKISGDALPPRRPLLRLAGYLHDNGKPAVASYDEKGNPTFIGHEKTGAKIVAEELARLRFSQKEITYVRNLITRHMRSFKSLQTPRAVRRLLKQFCDDNIHWKDWLHLKIADRKGNLKKADYTPEQIRCIVLAFYKELRPPNGSAVLSIKDLNIDGEDIIASLKVKPGPHIGRILKALLELVLDNPSLNQKKKLLQLAEQIHAESNENG